MSIFIGIPNTPDRGVDPGLGEPLGASDRLILGRPGRYGGSRFSRSRALIFSAISVGRPARLPLSSLAYLAQSFSVCGGAADLRLDRPDLLPERPTLGFIVENQPYGTVAKLGRLGGR